MHQPTLDLGGIVPKASQSMAHPFFQDSWDCLHLPGMFRPLPRARCQRAPLSILSAMHEKDCSAMVSPCSFFFQSIGDFSGGRFGPIRDFFLHLSNHGTGQPSV